MIFIYFFFAAPTFFLVYFIIKLAKYHDSVPSEAATPRDCLDVLRPPNCGSANTAVFGAMPSVRPSGCYQASLNRDR